MATVEDVIIEIDADVSKLRKEIKSAQQSLKGFEKATGKSKRGLDKLEKSAKATGSSFSAMKKILAGGIAIAGFRAVIGATVEQERVIAQLEARLKSTKSVAGLTSKQLQGMAASLQKVTTFGDEATIGMQSLLLTFTRIRGPIFKQAQESILNVAVAMGTDLKSAAVQVGKALNDPILGITALSRSGITFTETQKETIKTMVKFGDIVGAQKIILGELETQFGGAARAARETFGGALTGLSNAFGDLLEGKTGLREATDEIERLTQLLSDPQTVAAADKLASALVGIGTGAAGAIVEFANFGDQLGLNLAAIVGNLDPLDKMKQEIKDVDRALDGSFLTTPAKFLFTSEEELNRIKNQLMEMGEVLAATRGVSIVGIEDIKSVESEMANVESTAGDIKTALDKNNEALATSVKQAELFAKAFNMAKTNADAAAQSIKTIEDIISKRKGDEKAVTTLDALISSQKARDALARGDTKAASAFATQAAQQFAGIEEREGPQLQFGGFIKSQLATAERAGAVTGGFEEAQKTLRLEIDIGGETRSFAFTAEGTKKAGKFASDIALQLKKAEKTKNRTTR